MPNANKNRGNRGEYDIRDFLEAHGDSVERARGSDGRAFGEAEGVDLKSKLLGRIQVKSQKKDIPKIYQIPEGADCVVIRVKGGRHQPVKRYLLQRLEDAV